LESFRCFDDLIQHTILVDLQVHFTQLGSAQWRGQLDGGDSTIFIEDVPTAHVPPRYHVHMLAALAVGIALQHGPLTLVSLRVHKGLGLAWFQREIDVIFSRFGKWHSHETILILIILDITHIDTVPEVQILRLV